MSFRFELWTPPTATAFTRVIDDLMAVSGRGTVEASAYGETSVEIPRSVQALPGFLVGVYDGAEWIDDMLIERINASVDREGQPTKTLSGVQVNGLAARIGIYPADHPTSPSLQRDWIYEGSTAANPHEIIRALLDAAQARGAGLWLDLPSTATADALGLTWPGDVELRAAPPQSIADVLGTLHRLGVNWDITRKTEVEAGMTHDLNLYGPGSHRDRTGGDVAIISPAAGEVVDRLPEATVRLALGAGGLWVEQEDTALVGALGRWEQGYDQQDLLSAAALGDFLDTAETEDEHNRLALQASLRQDDQVVPLRHFRPNDLIPWQLPGLADYVERPVQTISWEHGDVCTYQVTGSRIYDPETAVAQAVTELLDEVKLRPTGQRLVKNISGDPAFGTTTTTIQTSTAIAKPGGSVDVEAYFMGRVFRPNANAAVVGTEVEISIDGGATWDSTGQEVLTNTEGEDRHSVHAVHVLPNVNPTGTIQSRCRARIVTGDAASKNMSGTLVTRVTPSSA